MNIDFICEHCGKQLSVEDYLAGQQIACYHCKQPVVIPPEGVRTIIEFQCLGCGAPFRVPASKAGSRTTCPKCQAVLVVPGESAPAPPPIAGTPETAPSSEPEPVYEDELPAPSPLAARRSRTAQTGVPADRGEPAEAPVYVPPTRKVSPAWILFWVVLALFALGAVVMFIANSDEDEEDFEGITAGVKYKQTLDVFEITNATKERWTNLTLTCASSAGEYTTHLSSIAPGETVPVHGTDFKSVSGEAFKSHKVGKATLVITVTLPKGRRGRQRAHWASRSHE